MSDYLRDRSDAFLDDIIGQLMARKHANNVDDEELAAAIGRTPYYIKRIEAKLSHPTHRELYQLSEALGVSVRELINGRPPMPPFAVCRHGEGIPVYRPNSVDQKTSYRSLTEGFPGNRIQVLRGDFPEGVTDPDKHYHLGDEVLLMLEGQLEYTHLNEVHVDDTTEWRRELLSEGDCTWLRAWVPHTGATTPNERAAFLLFGYDPRGDRGMYDYAPFDKTDPTEIWGPEKNQVSCLRGLGPHVKEARLRAGMSLTALAKKVGKSPSYISKIERNETNPEISTIIDISLNLGRSPADFLPEPEAFLRSCLADAKARLDDGANKTVPLFGTDAVDRKEMLILPHLLNFNNVSMSERGDVCLQLCSDGGEGVLYVLPESNLKFYCWEGLDGEGKSISELEQSDRSGKGTLHQLSLDPGDLLYLDLSYPHALISTNPTSGNVLSSALGVSYPVPSAINHVVN